MGDAAAAAAAVTPLSGNNYANDEFKPNKKQQTRCAISHAVVFALVLGVFLLIIGCIIYLISCCRSNSVRFNCAKLVTSSPPYLLGRFLLLLLN